MLFPIFIFKDRETDFGVIVPGLPGCFSSGRTIEEAMENAKEAIELHLEGLSADGEEIPEQGSIDDYKEQIKAGGIPALVEVNTEVFEAKQSERVNVTFPKRLLSKIDKTSEKLGMTRSGLLQTAAKKYIVETEDQKVKPKYSVKEPKPKKR